MKMQTITSKPLGALPSNAQRAKSVTYIHAKVPMGGPGRGIFVGHGSKAYSEPVLMSWGLNADRALVEKLGLRKFVWVGTVRENDELRDNFEEVL